MKRVVWIVLGCLTFTACGHKEPAAEPLPEPEPVAEMAPAEPVAEPVADTPAEPPATPEPAANGNPLPLPEWEVEVQSAPAPQPVSATPAPQPAAAPRAAAATPAADFNPPAAAKPQTTTPKPAPKKTGATVVVAEVQSVSEVPDPGSVPYKECLTFLKYKVVSVESGSYDGQELLAAHWGMKDGRRTAAAAYKVGQRQKLTIEPLDKHPDLSRVMQADDTGEYSLSPYFVVSAR